MEENIKPKTALRVKEKRQYQDGLPKKSNKYQGFPKTDFSQLNSPKIFEGSSSVKKLFNEAHKIVQIGIEKDYVLLERETTLQNSNETVENLRKNMLHLQMEYEKLDQNFQRELSYRSDIDKRMDATKELVESVVQCSNVLAASLKQLEEDKFKIAEFYELIYQNQKEVETKHARAEKFVKEQNELLNSKLGEIKTFQDRIAAQHSETVSQLNIKLTYANEKLKTTSEENEYLQEKVQELQESSTKLHLVLEQQEKLNSMHQENIIRITRSLKTLKIQRLKTRKMLKSRKRQLLAVVNKNKNLKKNIERIQLLYDECVSINKTLESNNIEWRNRLEKQLEEDAAERQNWQDKVQEILNTLSLKESEIQDLKTKNTDLNKKIMGLTSTEGAKQLELEQTQNDLSKMLNENLRLKEDVTKLNEENKNKTIIISELEIKSTAADSNLNSQINLYKNELEKLREIVKTLEGQLSEVQETLAFEKAQKENISTTLNNKLQKSIRNSSQRITTLEKLLEEKTNDIRKFESEKAHSLLNGKEALDKLNNELEVEKLKNKELNKNFENITENYKNVIKQLDEAKKQNLGFEEKLSDLHLLNKTLTRTQNELEENAAALKGEVELEKKSYEALKEKHKKAEKELSKMKKLEEENSVLKKSTDDLKKLLEATEARLEAYKVVVKKLEGEKTETRNIHSEEVSKLKSELIQLQESIKNDKVLFGSPQKNFENSTTELLATKEKKTDCSSSQRLNAKENEPEARESELWQGVSVTPQGSKKFLSTPGKVFSLTSTPQSGFRNLTPIQKKRDPYEFDSDSSVERFDQEKVLRVFNRQKKESNKRSRTKK